MDDLTRFALAWSGLLVLVALLAFRRRIGRVIAAHLLAYAIRRIVRSGGTR